MSPRSDWADIEAAVIMTPVERDAYRERMRKLVQRLAREKRDAKRPKRTNPAHK